jgi:leucyl aminopeptidase
MATAVRALPIDAVDADVLAVPLAESAAPLAGVAAALDSKLDGAIGRAVGAREATTEIERVAVLHVGEGAGVPRVAVAGVGPAGTLHADALRTAAGAVARLVTPYARTLAWALDPALGVALAEQARAVVDGTLLGAYDPGLFKTGERREALETLALATPDPVPDAVARAAERAGCVATWANRARDLANRPPNDLTPEQLGERAREIAGEVDAVTVETLGPEDLSSLGMGAFAAVARGSHNPARLIVMRYEPGGARSDVVLGLVGKAVTFDTGGISIKPALYMDEMKGDMAGGGAVLESIGALAELGVPVRVVAVVGATENMPGGGAFRPGDIVSAMNGKTIEVINTDAEGRLVLADGLWYARQQGATHVLDLATLTGAMVVALGDFYAGVFSNDDAWRDLIVRAGEASGDHVWPLPLHPRYRRYIDSHYADLKNASVLRQGSAVLAAEFLQEFAGEGPWAHLDIAGPAFLRYSRPDYFKQRGGTGYGVRLIVELAERIADRGG